jgi:hypothetical protein
VVLEGSKSDTETMAPPPEKPSNLINVEMWNEMPDLDGESPLNKRDVNTWLMCRLERYREVEYEDEDLWDAFREDFDG